MSQFPLRKIQKGLDQKVDPEAREGCTTCKGLSLERIGSGRAVPTDEMTFNYGANVHSQYMGAAGGAEVMLIGSGTSLYSGGVNLKNNLSGKHLEFASMNSIIYFTNETDGLWYYDGGAVFRAGAPVPAIGAFAITDSGVAAASEFSSTATGYNFKVTYINDHGYDGNPSPTVVNAPAAITAGHSITLSNIPINATTDYNIVGRHIWIQGGDDLGYIYPDWVLLLTILDNTTTTATVATIEDPAEIMEDDNDLPPYASHLFVNYGCLFLGQDNSLRYSKLLAPEQWPTAQDLVISSSGDPQMAGFDWNGSGWSVTRRKIYQIIGSPGSGEIATNFYVKESKATKGTIATASVVPTHKGVFYEAEDGLYVFDGDISGKFSDPASDTFEARNTTDTYEALSVGAYWDNRLLMSFCLAGSTTCNETLIYDFTRSEWTSEGTGYSSFWSDPKSNTLHCGTTFGVVRFRYGDQFKPYTLKMEFCPDALSYASFGKFQVDMIGECTVNVYCQDVLQQSYTLSRTTRGFETRRFPLGLFQRGSIELIGSAQDTQNVIYGIGYSAEVQRGQV